MAELCAGKQVVIFGVPGAFTPGCSKTHLPGYVEAAADMKAKGVSEIVCVSVNDPFVMEAWGKDQGADGKVRMLADTCGDLAKALDLQLDLAAVLGSMRCKRFSMLVEDGTVAKALVLPAAWLTRLFKFSLYLTAVHPNLSAAHKQQAHIALKTASFSGIYINQAFDMCIFTHCR